MSEGKVIPFRKRPPSKVEMDIYRQITRGWHPEMQRLMFPQQFALDQKTPKR